MKSCWWIVESETIWTGPCACYLKSTLIRSESILASHSASWTRLPVVAIYGVPCPKMLSQFKRLWLTRVSNGQRGGDDASWTSCSMDQVSNIIHTLIVRNINVSDMWQMLRFENLFWAFMNSDNTRGQVRESKMCFMISGPIWHLVTSLGCENAFWEFINLDDTSRQVREPSMYFTLRGSNYG